MKTSENNYINDHELQWKRTYLIGACFMILALIGVFIDLTIEIMTGMGMFSEKLRPCLGLAGSIFIIIYLALVTFVSSVKSAAMLFSAPGGIMLILWMILFTARLFKLYLTSEV